MKKILVSLIFLLLVLPVRAQVLLGPNDIGTVYRYHTESIICWNSSWPGPYTICSTMVRLQDFAVIPGMAAGFAMYTEQDYIFPCETPLNSDAWCNMWEFHKTYRGVLEFDLLSTMNGQSFPTENMTTSNWAAFLEDMQVAEVWSPGQNMTMMLRDLADTLENGVVDLEDYDNPNSEIDIVLFTTIPEQGTLLPDIDVTEMLRRDLFGEGMGQDMTGFMLKMLPGETMHDKRVRFYKDLVKLRVALHTPTPAPTATPTITPTITPTATPPEWRGVKLILPGSPFTGDDLFRLRTQCMGDPDDSDVNLYVILDVYGEYWFHPIWSQTPAFESIRLNPSNPVVSFILDFIWPSNIQGSADGFCFWSAILDPATSDLIGDFDRVEFGYY